MIARRALRTIGCLALIGLVLAAHRAQAQPSDDPSCADAGLPLVLSNHLTLDATTRLFTIESSDSSTLSVQSYELDARNGKPRRPLWESQLSSKAHQSSEVSRITSRTASSFDAILIGPPRLGSSRAANEPSYGRFAEMWSKRSPTLFVTTQDGELFTLDAETGQSAQIKTADTGETHRAAGAMLATGHALINEQWRTLVVAMTQSDQPVLLAIDATDPNNLELLWSKRIAAGQPQEQHNRTPVIARLRNRWVVMVAGSGALHVHDAASGAVLQILAVDSSAAALTDPLAVDLDGDGKVERAYAGDSLGKMWRFDLSHDDPQQWHIAFSGRPLLTVTNHDGTAAQIHKRPEIALNRDAKTPVLLFAAHLNDGLALFGAYDRDRPLEAKSIHFWGTKPAGDAESSESWRDSEPLGGASGWRRDLRSSNGTLEVSAPRVHDGQVTLILTRRPRGAACRASADSLIAYSIEDGNQRFNVPLFSSGREESEGSGAAELKATASRIPVILDQLTPAGTCLRHYYLGFDTASVVHETRSCRTDTFGRQSWRQLR